MELVLSLVPLLGCALMMALMMMLMGGARPRRPDRDAEAPRRDEVAALREEVARLRAEGAEEPRAVDG